MLKLSAGNPMVESPPEVIYFGVFYPVPTVSVGMFICFRDDSLITPAF
ncbi:hypothetical protein JW906_02195 [bacterium]|nr:hypothetical protein [bacterium]